MQRNVKSLIGFTMGATDGEIGKVVEFYFDDETWTIRYLIVKTGSWLTGRKVLISPTALKEPDWNNRTFPVNLTTDQVKHSPDIDTEMPVSRQHELALYEHYSWPYSARIGTGFYGAMGMLGMVESRIPFEESIAARNFGDGKGDPHLRSTSELKGSELHTVDGEIGEVEDLIIDDTDWSIHFLIVDTGKWFPGKKVLIAPKWIKEAKWDTYKLLTDIPTEAIKESPEYDLSVPLPLNFESDLYRYYGKSKEQ